MDLIWDDLKCENSDAARKHMLELWDWLAELSGNRQLLRLYKSSAYGLFYRIPGEFYYSLYADENAERHLRDLTTAIRQGEAIAAEQAIEALTKVP